MKVCLKAEQVKRRASVIKATPRHLSLLPTKPFGSSANVRRKLWSDVGQTRCSVGIRNPGAAVDSDVFLNNNISQVKGLFIPKSNSFLRLDRCRKLCPGADDQQNTSLHGPLLPPGG